MFTITKLKYLEIVNRVQGEFGKCDLDYSIAIQNYKNNKSSKSEVQWKWQLLEQAMMAYKQLVWF